MPESNLAIGLVITPAAALMPVRGRITRLAARPAADRSSFGHVSPLDPIREDSAAHRSLPEIVLSASSPSWIASLDPVAQYQLYANLLSAAYQPAVSLYA